MVDVIVTFNSAPGLLERVRILGLGGLILRELKLINGLAIRLPAASVLLLAAIPGVTWVSMDAPVRVTMDVGRPTSGVPAIGSTLASFTGTGVTVAVLDSGVASHADLKGHIKASVTIASSGFVSYSGDPWGHGTHVAGIIAGSGSRSSGLYHGVAPGARIVSVKVLDANGAGKTSDVIAGIEWVVNNRSAYGIRILNLSLGHPIYEPAALDPLVRAVESAWNSGLVTVCSAGNRGRDGSFTITSPGNSSKIITAGSLTDWNSLSVSDDRVSTYSSRGPTRFDHFVKPDLIAPGNRIVSLRAAGSGLDVQHPDWRVVIGGSTPEYFEMSGTSMAAPMVCGAAALTGC